LPYHFRTQLKIVTHLGPKGIAKPDKQPTALGMQFGAVGRKEDKRPLLCQGPGTPSEDSMLGALNFYLDNRGSRETISKYQVV